MLFCRFYWTTRSKFVSRIFIVRSFLHGLMGLSAVFDAASFLTYYYKLGTVFGQHQTTDNFMFTHQMFLIFLQRLAVFVSMTLSFMRSITILVPFRKIASGKVFAVCAVYGMVIVIVQLFGGPFHLSSKQCLATNIFILAPDNISFFYIFYVTPFLVAGLVTLASIIIATWKLHLKKNKYNNQTRETRVRREMTTTIRMTGMLFLVCNIGFPVFLTTLAITNKHNRLRSTLSSRIEFVCVAYILGNVMSYVEAAATPIILTIRGSQLKRVHRENLQRVLNRISSRRELKRQEEPDQQTLQFLAASSMQLSSIYQDVVIRRVNKQVSRDSRGNFGKKRRCGDQDGVISIKNLSVVTEEGETSQSGIQATKC